MTLGQICYPRLPQLQGAVFHFIDQIGECLQGVAQAFEDLPSPEMRKACVLGKLDPLGINQHQLQVLGSKAPEQRQQQGMQTHTLTTACGPTYQKVGCRGQIEMHGLSEHIDPRPYCKDR